jgi:hypothetical protein
VAKCEKNGHVADRLEASKLVLWYSQALALWRRDKGKPAARWGHKAYGPPRREVAGPSNGSGGATKLRPQRGEGTDAALRQTRPYISSASPIFRAVLWHGGTPSAVLVDVEGKDASEVAVGTLAVLEIAGARRSESACT